MVGRAIDHRAKGRVVELLANYENNVLRKVPGQTNLAEHKIRTGDAIPVQLPPHHIPQAHRKQVENEIHEMLFHGGHQAF